VSESAGEDLRLGDRAGLPDELAFLRGDYPRGGWRAHANFGQLADFWLHIHATLRNEGSEVLRVVEAFRTREIDGPAFQRAFVPRLNGFLQHLDQHHRIEDQAYFPKFRQLDARLVVGFDLLEADHALIHERLVQTVEQARGLLNALATGTEAQSRAAESFSGEVEELVRLLEQHLADEEDLVIPAMLKHGERPLL
jgi:iron-sulfur cluster repair protein YtfE (RIC family)